MEKRILSIAGAPLSWNGREFEAKSKVLLTLGEVTLEKQINNKTKEEDGMIV